MSGRFAACIQFFFHMCSHVHRSPHVCDNSLGNHILSSSVAPHTETVCLCASVAGTIARDILATATFAIAVLTLGVSQSSVLPWTRHGATRLPVHRARCVVIACCLRLLPCALLLGSYPWHCKFLRSHRQPLRSMHRSTLHRACLFLHHACIQYPGRVKCVAWLT